MHGKPHSITSHGQGSQSLFAKWPRSFDTGSTGAALTSLTAARLSQTHSGEDGRGRDGSGRDQRGWARTAVDGLIPSASLSMQALAPWSNDEHCCRPETVLLSPPFQPLGLGPSGPVPPVETTREGERVRRAVTDQHSASSAGGPLGLAACSGGRGGRTLLSERHPRGCLLVHPRGWCPAGGMAGNGLGPAMDACRETSARQPPAALCMLQAAGTQRRRGRRKKGKNALDTCIVAIRSRSQRTQRTQHPPVCF